MSTALGTQPQLSALRPAVGAAVFVVFALLTMGLTATLPIGMSVAIVFLFAGPHNYVEARYFLTRLPARMGRLRGFFAFSAFGIICLTVAYPLLTRIPRWFSWPRESMIWTIGCWNTALILWVTRLIAMRSAQPPRRNWDYAWPLGIGLIGISWLNPLVLPMMMVYLHPLAGLWVLDREIADRRPGWRRSYRCSLLIVPLLVAFLWYAVPGASADESSVSEGIRRQITLHSGGGWVSQTTGYRLIATHAFLEMLHYAVWIVAIPLASGRVFSRNFNSVPLMKRSELVRKVIRLGLMVSAFVVVVLWLCFAADYRLTRDVYFTVATLHVLAEIPFLLRL